MCGQHRIECLGLRHVARKSVEDEAPLAVRPNDPAIYHFDDDVVGNELAAESMIALTRRPKSLSEAVPGAACRRCELHEAAGLLKGVLPVCPFPRRGARAG